MTLTQLLVLWVHASEFKAPNGWKSSGIEHRIMREAGLVKATRSLDPNGVGEVMCKLGEILKVEYPDEVRACYVWAKCGFKISGVKRAFGIETRAAHQLLDRGKHLIHGGYLSMKSISYVNEGER